MHNLNVVAATPFLLRIKEATTSHDYCYYYAQCYDECEHIETLFFFNPISGARGGAVIHCSTYCIGLHNTPGAHGNECCHVFFCNNWKYTHIWYVGFMMLLPTHMVVKYAAKKEKPSCKVFFVFGFYFFVVDKFLLDINRLLSYN